MVDKLKGIDPVQKVEENPKCENSNLAISISKIDKQGYVDVQFSELMFDETIGFVLDRINNESVRIEVIQTETGKNLDMKWSPLWFELDTLKINLTFANPLEVSQSALKPDKVVF